MDVFHPKTSAHTRRATEKAVFLFFRSYSFYTIIFFCKLQEAASCKLRANATHFVGQVCGGLLEEHSPFSHSYRNRLRYFNFPRCCSILFSICERWLCCIESVNKLRQIMKNSFLGLALIVLAETGSSFVPSTRTSWAGQSVKNHGNTAEVCYKSKWG